MSLIFSWMRQGRPRWLFLVCLAQSALAAAGFAETVSVRLANHFRDASGYPMNEFGSLADVLQRQNLGVQLIVKNADSCQDLLALPEGKEQGYDKTQNTHMIIRSLAAECWAILQFDPATQVAAPGPADRITPDIIRGIVADAGRLSAADEVLARTLMAVSGGEIACRDEERCRLSLPDGRDPPQQSLGFDLILAVGDERFIKVAQLVYGRAIFYYGLRWRSTASGGEVTEIFPQLR